MASSLAPRQDGIAHIEGLVQERRNSSALAMELRLSCTNPSVCHCSMIGECGKWMYWELMIPP